MIQWVDTQCRSWGAHKLWLMYGNHGWAPLSLLGKLIKEGPGAGHGSFMQRIPIKDAPEPYTIVNLALTKMADTHEMERPWLVIHAHYLINGKAKQKAPELGMSVATYWSELQSGHAFISACDVPREAELSRQNLATA